jgi:hypothetical protein
MMALNLVRRRLPLQALLLSCGLLAGTATQAQDLSVPADPVAAIEGDWNGIWEEWSVTVTNGRVVLTKGDPKTYSWLPVGTVLGVLNNNGKSEPRAFRFSASTCLDHQRDQSPSEYKTIPCGDFGAVLSVYADSYELKVSGISLRRPKNAVTKGQSPLKAANSKKKQLVEKAAEVDKPAPEKGSSAAERQRAHEAVEQRNNEAQAKYEADLAEQQRKVAEFERAKEEAARKTAEQQAAAQRSLDAYKAEQAAYAEQLLRHQQEIGDYQAKMIAQPALPKPAGAGGSFQATSGFLDTRGAALESLHKQPVAANGLSDVQCKEVTFYTPPKWTCWGFYRQEVKPAGASAQ